MQASAGQEMLQENHVRGYLEVADLGAFRAANTPKEVLAWVLP